MGSFNISSIISFNSRITDVWNDAVHSRTQNVQNKTKILICKNIDISAVMKIKAPMFDRPENLTIDGSVKLTENVLSFAIRDTYISPCGLSDVALHIVMFQHIKRFFLSVLVRIISAMAEALCGEIDR